MYNCKHGNSNQKHKKTVEKINTGNIYDLNKKDDGLGWKLEF